MKLLFLLLIAFTLQAKTIKVALAANVSYAIDDLIAEFQKTHKDIDVKYTVSGSGKLTAQIKNGAGFDLFLSANMKYPNYLYENKLSLTKPLVYAKGSLALFSTKKRDFSKGFELLKDSSIQKVAIANPKTAPYGVAATEALKNAKIYADIKDKLIFGESIAQTVTFAKTAADAGIVAKSTLYSKKMKEYKEGKNWIDVDSKLYTPIKQGIVLLNKDAQEFYNFILSSDAKKILKRYGYIVE